MGIPVCNETKGNEIELDKKRHQQLKKDLNHFKKKFKKNISIRQQTP